MRRMKAIVGVLLLACASIVFVILVGQRYPYSPLFYHFNSKHAMLDKAHTLNKLRYNKAMDYFYTKYIREKEHIETIQNANLDIVVTIVTVARQAKSVAEPSGYLIQTAASMDAMLDMDTGGLKTMLVVCNVNVKPERHGEAVLLQQYLPYINRKGSSIINLDLSSKPKLQNSKLTDKNRRREIKDYVFCLNTTRQLNSKYILVLEDDVVPEKDMLKVVEHTLFKRFGHEERVNINSLRTCAFLKLYYPPKWQGFAFEGARLLELLSIGIVGGWVLAISLNVTCSSYRWYLFKLSIKQYMFWAATVMTLSILIGRIALLELRRISPWIYKFGPSSACCTQAMLYPTQILPDLMSSLLVNNSLNKDLAIYDFSVRHVGMQGCQLEPNLFKHTGMITSLSASPKYEDPSEYLFDMPFDLSAH